MAMYHEIGKLLRAPIEEALLKLYPAPVFKWLYEVNLRDLAQTHSDVLPQPERARPSEADKTPKKAYLITLLLAILRDAQLARRFFETLPPSAREVITVVTWERSVNLGAMEKTLGRPIAFLNPDERRRYYEPYFLQPEHGLLVLQKNANEDWSYFSESNPPKTEDFCLLLPDEIRKAFKKVLPPPAGYEILPLNDLPPSIPFRYSCVQQITADLRLVAEYIAQGHLKYTKSEQVASASIRFLHGLTGAREFFPKPEDSDLALLRTRLLVGGTAFAGAKEREHLLARRDSAEPVRELLEKLLTNAAFLHEELLDHLNSQRNRWLRYSAPSMKSLASFFGKLTAEKWVSWENLRSYHTLRDLQPTLFESGSQGVQAHAASGTEAGLTSYYLREQTVGERNQFALIGEPLLKGYAFLLAAFGLAEIAYDLPANPAYHHPKKGYLTPYDGLRFVRLTPLGEFVFRRRDKYEVTGELPAQSPILLDESRLLATCRKPDQLTVLALGQFMETLAAGYYQMTPKSFLGGCRSREDIEERIRLFRRVVTPTPPAIWETFFERILARIAPLTLDPDWVVFKVNAEDEIRHHIASDPVLREIILKVEGLRIAVRRTDFKKLAKRLEHFGYLSSIPH